MPCPMPGMAFLLHFDHNQVKPCRLWPYPMYVEKSRMRTWVPCIGTLTTEYPYIMTPDYRIPLYNPSGITGILRYTTLNMPYHSLAMAFLLHFDHNQGIPCRLWPYLMYVEKSRMRTGVPCIGTLGPRLQYTSQA